MKRSDETLDPKIESELEALERALAGLPLADEMAPLATLVDDLREERPEPDGEWAAELDRRAAGGFADRAGTGAAGSGSAVRAWIDSLRPRSLLAPATLAVVVAVGIGVTQTGGGADGDRLSSQDPAAPAVVEPMIEDGQAPGDSELPLPAGPPEEAPPGATLPESAADEGSAAMRSSGASTDPGASGLYPPSRNSKIAPGRDKRLQDRSAYLALKTETGKVREVSDEAIQITESAGGIVVSSNLSETRDRATASLELSIPTRELDPTLDRLTDLATVASLDEASVDITRPFVSAKDDLEDARAEREQLLEALAEAEGGNEAEAIRIQLDDVRKEISRAEAAFENIARRARLSTVSLQIEGTPNGEDDGSWGLGDAVEDALDALTTVAGVMLVGAAIVLPIFALIALLVWAAMRARRRNREKALDD